MNRFLEALESDRIGPLIIAHRGDSAHAPENTLEAATLAHERGADAWELDVQLTRDGVPVVIHDESLLRTTDVAVRFTGDRRVAAGAFLADFDYDEIAQLDAGSWFRNDPSVRIPTLRSALDFTKESDWLVNIELKSFPNHDARLIDAVFHEIDATGTADRILISSFDHEDVFLVSGRNSGVATGVLASTPIRQPELYVHEVARADCYHAAVEILGSDSHAYRGRPVAGSLRAEGVQRLRFYGIPILVYTVNDVRLASQLAAMGVNGIFTDDPGKLLAAFS